VIVSRGQSLRMLVTTAMALLAITSGAEGQVGLTSGMTQVALVARVAPRGSIQGVSAQRETGKIGAVREVSVTVRMTTNTGYRLVVKATEVPAARIWVRSVTGEFQELTAGSSVIVARDTRCAGQWEREVRYRIEELAGAPAILPVRYELAITPQS
jgi:hypothetical protein